ncbi:MAG: ASCH domain-containing protein [Candidatus Acidiferrales bacterium]
MNGLIIRSPWVEMILDGKKTWEIRGSYTHIRGKIALIRGGSGLVVGACNLVDVVGPLKRTEFRKHRRNVGLKPSEARWLPYENTYAWVLKGAKKFRRPRRYRHPSGAVIWVRLSGFRSAPR